MGHISKELAMVFDRAYKILYEQDNNYIDCKNLLLALATTINSFSSEILTRQGFNEDIAKSFILDTATTQKQRYISESAEYVINRAKEIAMQYGYDIVCSHHLLLAIIENSNKETAQLLKDYNLTKLIVSEIVDAMCYNGIGKNASKGDENKNIKLNSGMKNKELEKEILSALKNKNGLSHN